MSWHITRSRNCFAIVLVVMLTIPGFQFWWHQQKTFAICLASHHCKLATYIEIYSAKLQLTLKFTVQNCNLHWNLQCKIVTYIEIFIAKLQLILKFTLLSCNLHWNLHCSVATYIEIYIAKLQLALQLKLLLYSGCFSVVDKATNDINWSIALPIKSDCSIVLPV